jgi:DNA-binding NarL/FixJ family response regulator
VSEAMASMTRTRVEFSDGQPRQLSARKRLVIVAENSPIVEAIRIGFRNNREFNLVGHADGRRTSYQTILGTLPDVIMLDDMERSDRALELTRAVRSASENVIIIVLSVELDPEWINCVFGAGANALISKATRPAALATLVRESVSGHIVLRHAPLHATGDMRPACTSDDLPLTRREFEILQLVASGSSNAHVARRLCVTEQTVKFHLRNIYRKLDVANRTEASHYAHVRGLVDMREDPTWRQEPALSVAS